MPRFGLLALCLAAAACARRVPSEIHGPTEAIVAVTIEPIRTPAPLPLEAAIACPESMVWIPGGIFEQATIADYCIDRTEVTVAAYHECIVAGSCVPPEKHIAGRHGTYPLPNADPLEHRDVHPITGVTWGQAKRFCAWRGGRLPSVEEWRWAARGREIGRKYPWEGDDMFSSAPCDKDVWDDGPCATGVNPGDRTRDGVLDMGGNAREWTRTQVGDEVVKVWTTWFMPLSNPRYGTATGIRCVRPVGPWVPSSP